MFLNSLLSFLGLLITNQLTTTVRNTKTTIKKKNTLLIELKESISNDLVQLGIVNNYW